MKKILLCFWMCSLLPLLRAQFYDDFQDSSLSLHWSGMRGSFIAENGMLRSRHMLSNSVFYLSRKTAVQTDMQWESDIHLLFNPSSLNSLDLILFSDSQNLNQAGNGYLLRLGGSSDEISLLKLEQGKEVRIIDGKDGLLNQSSSAWRIRVLYRHDSLLLYFKTLAAADFEFGGAAGAEMLPDSIYSGFRIRQSTASFFGKHLIDNVYAGPLIRDTLAPLCDSLRIAGDSSFYVYMNERCDSLSLSDPANYYCMGRKAVKAVFLDEGRSVWVIFPFALIPDTLQNLCMRGISDLNANRSDSFCVSCLYIKPVPPVAGELLMTELMVDPEPSAGLPENEYIEIRNMSGRYLSLAGCRISDALQSFLLPPVVLAPDSFYLPLQIPVLNNSTDRIRLSDASGHLLQEINYSDTWYRDPQRSQGGYSLEMIDLNRPCAGSINWIASRSAKGGTPGFANSVQGRLPADTSAPELKSYALAKDSLLILVFDQPLDSMSDLVWEINGQTQHLKKQTSHPETAAYTFVWPFLPHPDSVYRTGLAGIRDCEGNTGRQLWLDLRWPALCRRGGLLLNELLFNPWPGEHDFIELYNHSGRALDLSALFLAGLDGEGNLKTLQPLSPSFRLLPPSAYVLISEDTSGVCSRYACPDRAAIKLQLKTLPSLPDEEGALMLLNILGETVDSLHYHESWHHPLIADQNGVSLERLSPLLKTQDAGNWHSAASVVGYASPGALNSQHLNALFQDAGFSPQSSGFSPDMDGKDDVFFLAYRLPGPGFTAQVRIFDLGGRQVKTLLSNEILATEGMISWDGSGDDRSILPEGIYVISLFCSDASGRVYRKKFSVALSSAY